MITTVCLNPCIDRTIGVEALHCGGTNRVRDARCDVGGKGINVAAAAAQLGEQVCCISFLHENGGSMISDKLHAFGAESCGIHIPGTLRTNVKIFSQTERSITELNESGAPVSSKDLDKMTALLLDHAQSSDLLVLSGSVPPGCPEDYYRQIISKTNRLGCKCFLDADGEKLREGLKARPYLVKPNIEELEALLGCRLTSLDAVSKAASSLIDMGVSIAAVSMGADGCIITDGHECLYAPRMAVEVCSTVGAGDSMVAAFAVGCRRGLPLEEIFRMGVAAASAAVAAHGTQPPEKGVYTALLERVTVKQI